MNGDERSADDASAEGPAAKASEEPPAPTLRVVRGDTTPEEVAALVTVLTAAVGAAGATGDGSTASGRSAWSNPVRSVREALPHGPSAWRASAWPR